MAVMSESLTESITPFNMLYMMNGVFSYNDIKLYGYGFMSRRKGAILRSGVSLRSRLNLLP